MTVSTTPPLRAAWLVWGPEPGGVIIDRVDSDEPVSQPSEKVHTERESPAITLDKVKRMTPFFSVFSTFRDEQSILGSV